MKLLGLKNPFAKAKPQPEERSTVKTIGAAKDWPAWLAFLKTIGVGDSGHGIVVSNKNAESVPAYWRAKTLLAEQIAGLPFSVYTQADGSVTEAVTHPAYNLLKFRPHPKYNSFEFREMIVHQVMDTGNSLIRIRRDGRGAVGQLEIMMGGVDYFDVNGTLFYKDLDTGETLRQEDVIHIRVFSKDGMWGRPLVEVHQETLGRAIAEMKTGSSFYGKRGQLDYVMETEMPLSKEDKETLRNSFEAAHVGFGENKSRMAIASHGSKIKQLGHQINAADIDARRMTTEDIANITGVPPFLLSNLENSNFRNVEMMNRTFVQYTLRTWAKRVEAEMNSKLFSERDRNKYFVRFNLDGLLRGDTATRAEYYMTLRNAGALSPNDIRRLENMNPYEGGDRYDLPLASNIRIDGTGEENN